MTKVRAVALLLVPGAASAVGLACATTEDAGPPVESAPVIVPIPEAGVPADATEASAEASLDATTLDGGPCSAAGLCIVSAPIDTQINVTSIYGSGPNDVWAVGSNRTMLRYDGTVWEKAAPLADETSPFTMRSVWLSGPNDVWIGAGPIVYHSTGWKGPSSTEWTSSTFIDGASVTAIRGMNGRVLLTRQVLTDPWSSYSSLVAASGWSGDTLADPELVETPMFQAWGADGLWSLAMTRPDEAWATSLGSDDRPGARVFRIRRAIPDGGDADAGAPWSLEEYDSHTSRNLYGVWGDDQVVWAVGEGGALRRMTPALLSSHAFETLPSPVNADLRGVHGFGPNDVWAVGDDATVIHYDGNVWTRLATPLDTAMTKPRFFAVWGSAPNDVWIGGNGVMLHFEGQSK